MHQAISAFTRDSVPCPTPDDVAEALRYVGSEGFFARVKAWELDDIATYSRWLALPEDWINDIARDLAARSICRSHPAIIWG